MNTPVNEEIAKLLKDKKFDEPCNFYYSDFNKIEEFQYYHLDTRYSTYMGYPEGVLYFAPTIAEVVMWLYEKHGIWIGVQPTSVVGKFQFRIYYNNKGVMNQDWNSTMSIEYNSPTKGYTAGIKHVLKNLIKEKV